MKVLLLILVIFTGCSYKYYPDIQKQLILVDAYREKKSNKCSLPHHLRTWHVNLMDKNGKIISHHYFTESFAKQLWLVPGDKYTLQYRSEDSLCKNSYIYAILKRNH